MEGIDYARPPKGRLQISIMNFYLAVHVNVQKDLLYVFFFSEAFNVHY